MVVTRGQRGIVKPSYKIQHSVKAPRKKSSPRPKGFKHTMTESGAKKWIKGLRDSLPNTSVHDNSVDDLTNSFKKSKLNVGGKSKRRRRRSRRRQYTKKR